MLLALTPAGHALAPVAAFEPPPLDDSGVDGGGAGDAEADAVTGVQWGRAAGFGVGGTGDGGGSYSISGSYDGGDGGNEELLLVACRSSRLFLLDAAGRPLRAWGAGAPWARLGLVAAAFGPPGSLLLLTAARVLYWLRPGSGNGGSGGDGDGGGGSGDAVVTLNLKVRLAVGGSGGNRAQREQKGQWSADCKPPCFPSSHAPIPLVLALSSITTTTTAPARKRALPAV